MDRSSEERRDPLLAYPYEDEMIWVPCPKWVRVIFAEEIIADSKRVMLMRGRPPVYYFPREDVRMDLLHATDHTRHHPEKGEASYWSVEVGERRAENAAWVYENPEVDLPHLEDCVAFKWAQMDGWFEEDERIFVHPRDPYTRLDVLPSSRSVRVEIAGVTVAETDHPTLLFETGVINRYYFPRVDVRMEYLVESETETQCPYKGVAPHYSFVNDEARVDDVAWTYTFPHPSVYRIRDLIAFYSERVDGFYVDGEEVSG